MQLPPARLDDVDTDPEEAGIEDEAASAVKQYKILAERAEHCHRHVCPS